MAKVSTDVPAEILLAKRVQEMVMNDEEPAAQYKCRTDKDDAEDDNDDPISSSPIPIIDLSFLSCSEAGEVATEQELVKLKAALSSWGCFQAVGHGISNILLNEVQRVAREFFGQPMEEKQKYGKTVVDFEGYGADPVPEEGQSLDWSDRLFLSVKPEDQRNYKLWPTDPESFRAILEEYTKEIEKVTGMVSRAMAKSLDLDENCFLRQFGERSQLQARFNYYLPCKRPDLVLGLKPHADGTGYTIIMQDEVGLQIRKDDKWFKVPKNPGAILVLMGDQMQIMSNGIFKSPVHRVLSNAKRDRISVAMFYTPEVGKEIGPEDGLITEESPALYRKVKDYADVHIGYYNKGLRSIHTAQV
ncbi:OLC1v1037499C1 [Oldenlandia corymbosa var. corymbosa]|uniref:OLC1v1037499C1 n=1 Tax=Oldenlandia corymbosa var. corymbosa TaxID=529605 RepID=A0AAV1E4R6_OLDCO|nr:OLC1v1037499C1 [Oldenlandia corymbosa var. corymbosa]